MWRTHTVHLWLRKQLATGEYYGCSVHNKCKWHLKELNKEVFTIVSTWINTLFKYLGSQDTWRTQHSQFPMTRSNFQQLGFRMVFHFVTVDLNWAIIMQRQNSFWENLHAFLFFHGGNSMCICRWQAMFSEMEIYQLFPLQNSVCLQCGAAWST